MSKTTELEEVIEQILKSIESLDVANAISNDLNQNPNDPVCLHIDKSNSFLKNTLRLQPSIVDDPHLRLSLIIGFSYRHEGLQQLLLLIRDGLNTQLPTE